MEKHDKKLTDTWMALHEKAEELLSTRKDVIHPASNSLTETDNLKLIHELQLHQIELEMQNEELKLAKEKAELAEQKYTELYDFAPLGFISLSKEGVIKELNFSAASMLGNERSLLVKSSFAFFVSQDTRNVFNQFIINLFTNKTKETCEVTLETKNNSQIDVQITGIVSENKELGLLTVADITERKKNEEELIIANATVALQKELIITKEKVEESEKKYRTIIETTSQGFYILDTTGKIKDVNQAYCLLSGYTKEELLTMSIVDLNVNENKKEINLRIQNLFKAGKDRFETIHKRKDGSFRNVEINVTYFSYIEKLFVVFIHDITERKQAEQAIKKVKEQLESLTSAVPGVLYQFLVTPTGEWKFIYVSEGIKSLYEVTPDKAYNDHNVLTQCILQEDQISHRESVKSSFLNLSFWIHEHRIITPGGALKWVRGQAIPQRQEDGSVLWNGILIDITERKQIEQALKESEDKYRLLSEKTTDGISLVEHGKVKYVSDGYQKMLGYEKNEIEKITFEEIFSFLHPDDVKKILDQINLAHLQQENSFKYDYRARHKNSQYIWVEDMINAEYDDLGNHIRSVIHSRDISERKRMEQIKESRLHLLSDAAEKSLEELLQATLDELELLTESSIGFYHFLNADQETLILQTWSTRTIKEMCTAEGKGQHYNVSEAGVWGDCIRERRAIVYNDYATLLHHKGLPKGHAEIIRILVVPIFRGGSIVAILGVGNKPSDYTDHDIAIVSDLADLGWDIKEKLLAEQKLNKTMLELETLNNTKDKFFSIIAHDLRNPFAGIMGLSEIMETKLVESNKEPELLKYSQMIKTSSKHAFDLLDNLMHWARSQRGEISLNLQNIPMKYLLAITIPVVSGNAFKKSITLESQLSDEDIVYADDSLTSTILRNLLTNAIKFTNQNGKITISTNKKDEFLEISVTDTGVGIEAKNLDKIFRIDTKFSNVGRHEQRKRNWTWTYSL